LALESLVNVEAVFDITLILNSVEEIYQLSMTRQMLRDGIPEVGIKFTDQTIFIVLEAMEMIGVQNTGLPQPNYTDGVLIKVNDAHVVYGQLSSSDSNLAEAMLLTVLKSSDRRYQHTASLGTSDATAIAALSPFPNIACLAIPCQNKHNVATDGAIVAEKVLTYDVHSAIEVLGKMATMQELEPLQELLSVSLKNSDLVSHPTIKAAANARKRLLKHNAPRIEHRFFLSNSLWRKALLARTRLK